jgi:hypothetical protein
MEKVLNKFEKWVTYVLLITAMVVISFQVIQLIWELGTLLWTRLSQSGLAFDPGNKSNFAVLFFSVLLSMEVMETIRVFHQDHEI